jgi:hypothetical protein
MAQQLHWDLGLDRYPGVVEPLYSRALMTRSSKLCLQWSGVHPVLSLCHIAHGQRYGAILSSRLTTIAMSCE